MSARGQSHSSVPGNNDAPFSGKINTVKPLFQNSVGSTSNRIYRVFHNVLCDYKHL